MTNLNIALLSLTLFSSQALALASDSQQPINIYADSNTVDLNSNTTTFFGNVVATQGSIKMTGDKLIGIREKTGEIMISTGNPATFYQMMDDGKPINAQAQEIRYVKATNKIILSNNAVISQLDSSYKAEKITYDISSRKIEGKKGNQQTRTVFTPAQFESKKSDKSAD
ncbi:lipopolysaccharide transport periplasmic protein LptA [Motilimonas pumila]|uniref:Lipopolysaccharide export system protein LptA n=1 Tax=Motilimonas pumila TaxID=2303987 RepID=A0A418YIE4_9GAMM|nr:lipopolysaccharide transport periplasmic protein LptA [Motilimonas pumila]RJG50001.1 lipopolysaccharide transport periplasmic protein LptA [Motilimonas pumila]